MVFTRGQTSSVLDAAKALVSLRNYPVYQLVARVSTPVASADVRAAAAVPKTSAKDSALWSTWADWYHAFLSEATDDNPSHPIADRRAIATSRWVTFTSKKLRCSESEVRAWLRTADQKALLAACA